LFDLNQNLNHWSKSNDLNQSILFLLYELQKLTSLLQLSAVAWRKYLLKQSRVFTKTRSFIFKREIQVSKDKLTSIPFFS